MAQDWYNEATFLGSARFTHDLRHSKITWPLAEGAPIQTVQGLAGHSTVKMTERYYRYLHEHQRILVAREEGKTASGSL